MIRLTQKEAAHLNLTCPEVRVKKSEVYEKMFADQCAQYRLPHFETQHRFASRLLKRSPTTGQMRPRQERFDFAFLGYMVAVEIEGLVITRRCAKCYPKEWVVMGGHASPKGIKHDMDKYNAAAELGWLVLRFDQDAVKNHSGIEQTIKVLMTKGWPGPQ